MLIIYTSNNFITILQYKYDVIRKGVVTYSLSFPGGPNAVAAYLRARWSLGAVQQRYVFEGEGSDQFLGRVACGLPLYSSEFTVLPPHFTTPPNHLTNDIWNLLHPEWARMPTTFQNVMQYLLASLVFHKQWLEDTLSRHHPLFNTYLWTSGIIESLKENVQCGYWRCQSSGMVATGIPPFISIMHSMQSMGSDIIDVQDLVNSVSNQLMEQFQSKYIFLILFYFLIIY